jgi:hypothetical protein
MNTPQRTRDKLLERAAAASPAAQAPVSQYRKKSWLNEIFD